MKITACSIVKNEAHNIARCIESYKCAVDEIIIVDTGSTDNTVEICKAHGATTLFYEWNNDFSAAKNYALENAKGDWIIFLDADEWFVPKLKKADIINVLKNIDNVADGLMTTICEYSDKTDKVFARELVIRIFRNSKRIRFYGSIHERLKNNDNEIIHRQCPDIEIFHSGYANGLVKEKAKRNIDIMNNIYIKGEIATSIYFYLFRENYALGNLEDAIKFYELFMIQEDVDEVIKSNVVIICVYEYMYRIMVQNPDEFTQQEIDRLLDTAYNKFPKLPMHSYLIGCEKLKENDFVNSFIWISRAIELNRKCTELFSNLFPAYINEAHYKLGYISQTQGKLEPALIYYMEAVKGASAQDLVTVLSSVIKLIEGQPNEEIILFLNSLLDMRKKEIVECVLSVLKYTRLHKAFVYYAIKYNQEFDGQDDTTYIAMILSEQAELAIEIAIDASINAKKVGTEAQIEVGTGVYTSRSEYIQFSEDIFNASSNVEEIQYTKTDEKDENNWHIDYAIVAILYSKRLDLYIKYREHFNPVQRTIIEAYLSSETISNVTDELECEYIKTYNRMFYVFNESEMELFERVFTRK